MILQGILSELRDDLTSVIQEKIDILGVQDDVDVTDTTSSSTGGYLDEPSGVDSNEVRNKKGKIKK